MCSQPFRVQELQMKYTGRLDMDKIIVKNLKIFAYHGVNPEEKENGQNFVLDIDAYVDISKPCQRY